MMNIAEQRFSRRWEQYRRANNEKPNARERELRLMFERTAPQWGERIWEAGTGNGYLTLPLAAAVGGNGEVVTTDVEEGNILETGRRGAAENLRIRPLLLPLSAPFLGDEYAASFDAVVSIATLHHFDNRREGGTGEQGRRRALEAFYRTLKSGGRMVVADVAHDTITQRYFDAIDSPRFCAPHGHPHDFFTSERLKEIAGETGFRDISITIEFVPWRFSSSEEAQTFVHTIHNAQCSPEESFALAQKLLGFENKNTHHQLGWELFYLVARKS